MIHTKKCFSNLRLQLKMSCAWCLEGGDISKHVEKYQGLINMKYFPWFKQACSNPKVYHQLKQTNQGLQIEKLCFREDLILCREYFRRGWRWSVEDIQWRQACGTQFWVVLITACFSIGSLSQRT